MKFNVVMILFAVLAAVVSAQCQTFYVGLCPGADNCECTLGEACGTRSNRSAATAKDGGCSGSCRLVEHNMCAGPDDCLKDVGSCSAPPPPGPPPPGPSPSRDAIMSCAKRWVAEAVPYCQCNGPTECCGTCPYCGTFRCDCSGFVSNCLGLPYGYTTFTLPEVTHQISKGQLLPGDIMLCVSDHVVFFGGWTDGTQSNYVAYQEPGCHTTGPHCAMMSVEPYPFSWNPSCFVPYRLNGLEGEAIRTKFASMQEVRHAASFDRSFPDQYEREAKSAAMGVIQHLSTLVMQEEPQQP